MQYIKVSFSFVNILDYQQDLLISSLGDIGFDTFEDTENGFDAFIQADQFQKDALIDIIEQLDQNIQPLYTILEIEAENWNKEWEKNFEPLIIANQCYVRATFHEPQPQYPYQIIIDPKMAFGTGHHQTTTMMMEYILFTDVKDKVVLDMGCGTGILAILAAMKGAAALTAIDYDDVCFESTKENSVLNNINNIQAVCGGKEVIPDLDFDVILANIKKDGHIFLSGFYESPDLDLIVEACTVLNITYQDHKKNGDWVAAHFKKN